MKEFPNRYYQIKEKLKQSASSSTYVVKPHFGEQHSLILKLYTSTSLRSKLNSLEDNFHWQRGLDHPFLLGITSGGISGKSSIFTTRRLASDKLDLSKSTSIHVTQLLDVVSFLHRQGKIHGQLKPSNLFLVDGNLRLADLRLVDCDEYSDLEDIRFAAPELLLGKSPTVETDYYSMGAILYRIYARKDPFNDANPDNLKAKYLQAKIPSIRNCQGISEPVAMAINGLLHQNPRRRTAAFRELIREMPFVPESASRTPLVGRRDTFEYIYSQVCSTATNSLSVVLVEGDAGLGKSRLVEELQFKSNFYNSDFYRTTCVGLNEPSLAPVTRLIRNVLIQRFNANGVRLRTLLGNFENSLAPLFDDLMEKEPLTGIEQPKERIIQDLIGLISSFSRKEPLRLCIEDIDNAEPATRSFLRQICYRASDLNVRLVLTCRNSANAIVPGEIQALLGPTFTNRSLAPLTKSESRTLISYLESDGGKPRVWSRAGGNPLWLFEHARKENCQGLATSIYALIGQETDLELRKLMDVLAVNRGPSSLNMLAGVMSLEIESVTAKLARLRQIGAVHEANESYEVRSESLRSAIESEITARARRTIHESIYRVLQTKGGATEDRLADHAFFGGLWEQASVHIASLARHAAKRGDNVSVLRLYGRLKTVLHRLNRKLPVEVEIGTAVCLAKIGRTRKAQLIFQRCLVESDINDDLRIRLSILGSGAEIDCSNLNQRLSFLQDSIDSPISKHLHPSILLTKLSASLVAVGDLGRASDALNRAQEALKTVPDSEGSECVIGAEGYLLMNTGQFQAALQKYETLPQVNWGLSAAALTNRAFCHEQLGNIRSAAVIQKKALRLAIKAGLLVGQSLCLGNLGAFNTKLGNFNEARDYFRTMKQLLSELGPNVSISCKAVEAEEALLEFLEGKYTSAIQHLRSALNSISLLRNIRYQNQLLELEIMYSVGSGIRAVDVNQIMKEGVWSDSPLYAVQLALLRSRTQLTHGEALSCLDEALETARKFSLLYEVCRLELEKADRLRESDPDAAKLHSDEALRISKKNGYRPLQCRALLLRAMCSQHDKEKEHYLELCFKLATSIGIPEIVSESSYHLGVLYDSKNQTAASRECFANSTRITSEIADQTPARFRSAYLARPWRRDARRRYERHLMDQPIRMNSAETDPGLRDHRYFRSLYQISIAASSSRTTDDFLRALLPAMGLAREGVVAMLTLEGHTSWHSHGVACTDTLRDRVLSVSVKARGQARFNSNDRWIPFRSLQFSGGICVLSPKRSQMGEEELEFFTMLGIFASSALDQIHNRALATPVPAAFDSFHGIVGNSRPIRDLCALIARISNSSATVLIQGETGTGKELVANAIHKLSSRSKAPFIPIDCGAIPEGLLESELFGSKRGSFTGAIADRPGVFEAAHTGTLFLDEVSNMNLAMQAKLLRVLQEREIRRVGETRNRPVDVRLIAASNTNLKQLVNAGAFRQDLLFRLNVIDVRIPPLRARREDIPALASCFLKKLNSSQKSSKVFGPRTLEPLLTHDFPGNVRELQNSVERGFFNAPGQTILSIPVETSSGDDVVNEARKWLADLAEGRRNFWTEVRDRYRSRDISREKVVALIDLGLRTTRGSYKDLASLLHIDEREYRRLMDFLRRNNCLLDFRPYRKVASVS